MNRISPRIYNWALAGLLLILAGCANLGAPPTPIATGIDGQPCLGALPSAVNGLNPTTNPEMLAKAQMPLRKGGVCTAAAFAVAAPVTVFRVYDGTRPTSAYGGWWSLTRPGGSRDDYRAQNAICKAWSALDRLLACSLITGAEIVLGTTQSVTCDDGLEYPQTASIQVFVANDGRNNILYVENCRELGDWPG